ncbi:putative [histone H3]-dimethyl-L-lysine(36) demethylase [Helianthus annuus]|nr:putative [histone H3]-dimethyl-L-lysine(36) demethylase [Helianthus annuus]
MKSVNAWFGPAGTVTPLHHDPHHNILAQVVGKKYVRLYPASLSEELYPHAESMLKNSSQVDLDNFDPNEFPNFEDVEFMDCILEEGEMLYIPPKWWHYVRSLTTSLSVSFWWSASPSSPTS